MTLNKSAILTAGGFDTPEAIRAATDEQLLELEGIGVVAVKSIREACGKADILAHIAHEANRAYCRSIGDDSQPAWDDAPEWQRVSAIKGIEGALNGSTPEQSHESWMAEKVATGWVYGEVKDPEAKTHPCMVPYAELPDEQRIKDHLYLAVVKAAAEALK